MPRRIRYHFIALGLAVLAALLALPGGALAGKPERLVVPSEDFVVPAADGCGLDVLFHTEGDTIVRNVFDKQGNFVRQVVTVNAGGTQTPTNLDTSTALTIYIPGPGFFHVNADGTATMTGSGPWSWFGPLPLSDAPGIWLLRGTFVITFDDQGNPTAFTRQGPAPIDLCPRLVG